jgi:NADH-quinone oxidoreductase subunit J
MTLRRLVHCALALTVAFAGLAGLYLNLGAEFAGLAQLLVYVGAIAILIVFAILLTPTPADRFGPPGAPDTRGGEGAEKHVFSPTGLAGGVIALAVFAVLAWAVETSGLAGTQAAMGAAPQNTMQQIGLVLMQRYVLPLEVIALMLTAAMIGAVLLALREKRAAAMDTQNLSQRPEIRA